MSIKKIINLGPLLQGHQFLIAKEDWSEATEIEYQFITKSDSVLFSLQASVVSGDLDVKVYTEGDSEDTVGYRKQLISFPTLSAPTNDLLLSKTAVTLQKVRVVVTSTGAAKFAINAKGIAAGEAEVKIAGATVADNSGILIDTTPRLIFPVSLTDRNGVSVLNNSTTSTLYVGFKSTITTGNSATVGVPDQNAGTPIPPGSSIGLDIAAGLALYGVSDGNDIDVRLLEVG